MKLVSAVIMATTTVLLQNAGLVGALDMRFWLSSSCSGAFVQCLFSGNWHSRSRIGSAVELNSTEDCVEPDSFGFVDDTGKERITKITQANKKAIYGALEKGDVAALKTEAGAAA
ncbi:hypothetical protein H1R20_g15062, partial [Candolleomyces eurysporus]